MKGIDFGYGAINGNVIKWSGYDFVGRYLSHSPEKDITLNELNDFKQHNLQIVLVWETTTTRYKQGYSAGIEDANNVINKLQALNIANQQSVYFAIDDDIQTKEQYDAIADYFKGIATIFKVQYIGIYGGYNAVEYALDNGLASYFWQTYAWSHGKWLPEAQLRQIDIYGPNISGVNCDADLSMVDDFGQLKL